MVGEICEKKLITQAPNFPAIKAASGTKNTTLCDRRPDWKAR
jgi:hypothetical protein